jgi:hypothetical protein
MSLRHAACLKQGKDSGFFIERSVFFSPSGVLLDQLVSLCNVDRDALERDLVGAPRSDRVNHLVEGLGFRVEGLGCRVEGGG